MADDGCDCDLVAIINCHESDDFEVLQRLAASGRQIIARISASIEARHALAKDYEQKCEIVNEQNVRLHGEHKEKIAQREEKILERKVVDKKNAIMEKKMMNCQTEIEDAKSMKEAIALEMVDLMADMEERKQKRKEIWNAIKMACAIYKEKLDFHTEVVQFDDHERIQVTFFRHKNPDKDNYYVHLLSYKNNWKVAQIKPPLKEIHSEGFKTIIDHTKSLDAIEVTVFLCKLRTIFLKHYIRE